MEEEYRPFESQQPSEEQENIVEEYIYIFEDAITGSLQIIKKFGNIEPVLLSFNKFINVQDVLTVLQNLALDKKVEYPQFYIIKTKTPQNYI